MRFASDRGGSCLPDSDGQPSRHRYRSLGGAATCTDILAVALPDTPRPLSVGAGDDRVDRIVGQYKRGTSPFRMTTPDALYRSPVAL